MAASSEHRPPPHFGSIFGALIQGTDKPAPSQSRPQLQQLPVPNLLLGLRNDDGDQLSDSSSITIHTAPGHLNVEVPEDSPGVLRAEERLWRFLYDIDNTKEPEDPLATPTRSVSFAEPDPTEHGRQEAARGPDDDRQKGDRQVDRQKPEERQEWWKRAKLILPVQAGIGVPTTPTVPATKRPAGRRVDRAELPGEKRRAFSSTGIAGRKDIIGGLRERYSGILKSRNIFETVHERAKQTEKGRHASPEASSGLPTPPRSTGADGAPQPPRTSPSGAAGTRYSPHPTVGYADDKVEDGVNYPELDRPRPTAQPSLRPRRVAAVDRTPHSPPRPSRSAGQGNSPSPPRPPPRPHLTIPRRRRIPPCPAVYAATSAWAPAYWEEAHGRIRLAALLPYQSRVIHRRPAWMDALLARGLDVRRERVREYFPDNLRWNAELWKALSDFMAGYCRVMFSYVEHRWLGDGAARKVRPGWPCRMEGHEEHVRQAEEEVVEWSLGALHGERLPVGVEGLVVRTAQRRAVWKEARRWEVMVGVDDIGYESGFDPVEMMREMTESLFGAYAWSVMFHCCRPGREGGMQPERESIGHYTGGKDHLMEVVGNYVTELWPAGRPGRVC